MNAWCCKKCRKTVPKLPFSPIPQNLNCRDGKNGDWVTVAMTAAEVEAIACDQAEELRFLRLKRSQQRTAYRQLLRAYLGLLGVVGRNTRELEKQARAKRAIVDAAVREMEADPELHIGEAYARARKVAQ